MPGFASSVERRNFIANTVEGVLFIASGGFVSAQTVIPALIARLGGGNIAVGSVSVIVWVGLFLPQIFAARYVETSPFKKPWTLKYGFLHRSATLVIALVLLFFGRTHPTVALPLLLFLYLVMHVLMGITTPAWFDMFVKVTSPLRRGRLVGIRNSIGGGMAFLCGIALTYLFRHVPFPTTYALAFFFAFALQMGSWFVQTRITEDEPSTVAEQRTLRQFFGGLPRLLREQGDFRWFLVASAFLIVGSMPVGFFTVYALDVFRAGESLVGEFTLSIVAIQVVSALVNGYIADHYGNKAALAIAAVAMACASVTAIVAPSLDWFRLVYVFLGINLGTELMARYNLSADYAPAEQRSTYVGMMNTMLAPFFLSGIVGGWISDTFGYTSVFWTGAVFSLAGIGLLFFRVIDPRRRTRSS